MGFENNEELGEEILTEGGPHSSPNTLQNILLPLAVLLIILVIALGVTGFFYGFDLAGGRHTTPVQVYSTDTDSDQTASTAGGTSGSPAAAGGYTQSDDWRLLLVNSSYPISEDYTLELTELRYNQKVDSRIYPSLQKMFDDMRTEGLSPKVVSGYRTREEQKKRVDDRTSEYMGYGKSREEAEAMALQWEAAPGASEHELGICVDVTSEDEATDTAQQVWDWMDAHCADYGFIRRYPTDKSSVTGVRGERWHYRYVGEEAAREITEKGITLEEYLGAD